MTPLVLLPRSSKRRAPPISVTSRRGIRRRSSPGRIERRHFGDRETVSAAGCVGCGRSQLRPWHSCSIIIAGGQQSVAIRAAMSELDHVRSFWLWQENRPAHSISVSAASTGTRGPSGGGFYRLWNQSSPRTSRLKQPNGIPTFMTTASLHTQECTPERRCRRQWPHPLETH